MEMGMTETQLYRACLERALAAIGHPEFGWGPGLPDEKGISAPYMLRRGPTTPNSLYLTISECEKVRQEYLKCLPTFIYAETDEGPMGASAKQVETLIEQASKFKKSVVWNKYTGNIISLDYDFYDFLHHRIPSIVCKKPLSHYGFASSAIGSATQKYFMKEYSRTSQSAKYYILSPESRKVIAIAPEKFHEAVEYAVQKGWEAWNQVEGKFRRTNPSLQEFRQYTAEQFVKFVPGRAPTVDDFVASMRKYMEERLRAYRATTPGRLKPAVWDAIGEYAAKEVKIDLEAVSGYFLPTDFVEFCKYASGIILEFLGYTKGPHNQEAYYLSHDAPMTVLTSVQYSEWVRGR